MVWGMLRPGIMNDTIIPGYPITKFPVNLFSFNAINDGTIRSFGGQNQYVTYGQPMMSLFERNMAANFTCPNHISLWDPMLFTMGGMPTQSATNPYLQGVGLQNAYNFGFSMAKKYVIAQGVSTMIQTLSMLAKDKNLTVEEKEQIKEKLEELKELQKEVQKTLSGNPSPEELQELEERINTLEGEISELSQDIVSALKERAEEAAETDDDDDADADDVDDTDAVGAADDDDGVEEDNDGDSQSTEVETDKKTGRPSSLGTVPAASELNSICSGINKAYGYWLGTDKEKLDEGLAKINANNVIEVIQYWNDKYKSNNSGVSGGEFFKSMMDELNDSEQSSRIPLILDALKTRAEALGIFDTIGDKIIEVENELDSNWHDDTKLANLLKGICETIIKAEKNNVTKAQEADDKKKAEKAEKDKKAKVEKEAKNEKTKQEKLAILARDMRNELKLTETPELSDDIEVILDKNGNFKKYRITCDGVPYEAESYEKLARTLKKYNIDPKDALLKKALDTQS